MTKMTDKNFIGYNPQTIHKPIVVKTIMFKINCKLFKNKKK